MTLEERLMDLLAEGEATEAALRAALEEEGFDTKILTEILGDLTEADFVEVASRSSAPLRQSGDRILSFDGLHLALTPAGIKRWMLEDAQRQDRAE